MVIVPSRILVVVALAATPLSMAAPAAADRPVSPKFSVTVQPRAAGPGDPVIVSFDSMTAGVRIERCLAFFPGAAGDTCPRAGTRLRVRTVVPPDARPGPTLLRWGVESSRGPDNDAIPFVVSGPSRPSATPVATTGAGVVAAPGSVSAGGSHPAVGLIGWSVGGVVLLAGPLAFWSVRKRFRRRPADDERGAVDVIPVVDVDQMAVSVDRADLVPVRDLSVVIRRPELVIDVLEESP